MPLGCPFAVQGINLVLKLRIFTCPLCIFPASSQPLVTFANRGSSGVGHIASYSTHQLYPHYSEEPTFPAVDHAISRAPLADGIKHRMRRGMVEWIIKASQPRDIWNDLAYYQMPFQYIHGTVGCMAPTAA